MSDGSRPTSSRGRILSLANIRWSVAAALTVALIGLPAVVSPAVADDNDALSKCGSTAAPPPPNPRQINLVIDDSGSMFQSGSRSLDRWSFAKYSLEVFAALMGVEDTLNVYLMSDFSANSPNSAPAVVLRGSEDGQARVDKIRNMQLAGGGTPYQPVEKAYADIVQSPSPDKWLVILTDGKFDGVNAQQLTSDLRSYIQENQAEDSGLKVAFLSIGDEAQRLQADPGFGLFSEQAATPEALLRQMNGFANLIFERSIAQDAGLNWTTDIDMEQVVLFAQGKNVQAGDVQTPDGPKSPSSVVDVKWSDNPPVEYNATQARAVPNKELEGKLITYEGLPKGDLTFNVPGAKELAVFYKPRIDFGVILTDPSGQRVTGAAQTGEYTVDYGFMNEDCEIIQSPLLGNVQYSATLLRDGEVVESAFTPGSTIALDEGNYVLDVSAQYLDGSRSGAKVNLSVQRPDIPTTFTAESGSYLVSELAEFPPIAEGIQLTYVLKEQGSAERPPTAEEWASFPAENFQATSDSNLEFDVIKLDEPGRLAVVPRAPEGDVYAADTGTFDVTVSGTQTLNGKDSTASITVPVEVVDDLSSWDRLMHWLKTDGWKWLLLLLAVIILLGYLFKRRFSKKIRKSPEIVGTPNQYGSTEYANGKFRINSGRRYLPFLADTATLMFVPRGTGGFPTMKLKATSGKRMTLTNWKAFASKGNVAINGNPINEDTRKAPSLGPSSQITATSPEMTYNTTLT